MTFQEVAKDLLDNYKEPGILPPLIEEPLERPVNDLGLRFNHCTFANFKTTSELQEQTIAKCRSYLGIDKSRGESMIIYGASGTGKTHIVAAMLKEIKVDYKIARFEYISELKRVAQQSPVNWFDAVKKYCQAYLLVIPDLIVRKQGFTDSQKELLFYLIDERYNNYKPILLCTNVMVNDLRKAIDFEGTSRISDRLAEMVGGRIICFDWESYRQRPIK
jgi:DNA replication protein DnaC